MELVARDPHVRGDLLLVDAHFVSGLSLGYSHAGRQASETVNCNLAQTTDDSLEESRIDRNAGDHYGIGFARLGGGRGAHKCLSVVKHHGPRMFGQRLRRRLSKTWRRWSSRV